MAATLYGFNGYTGEPVPDPASGGGGTMDDPGTFQGGSNPTGSGNYVKRAPGDLANVPHSYNPTTYAATKTGANTVRPGQWETPTTPGAPPPPAASGPSPWDLPGGYDARIKQLQDMINQTQGMTATPSSGVQMGPLQQAAATQIAQMKQAQAAQLAQAQQMQAASLGPAAQAAMAKFGPAGMAAASMAGPAAQAQQSAFRNQQQGVLDQLNRWMTGQESVSQLQLKDAAARNIAQQYALANSARAGQAGLAQRMAAQQAGSIGANLANQQALAGIQERQAMAQQLGQQLGLARGQDEQLGMFNADQSNQNQRLNAQLGTSASISNAGNQTNMNIAQGQTGAQVGMFNAGQTNAMRQQQAALQQQAGLANMDAVNQRNSLLAQLAQQNNQFNANQMNNAAITQAGMNQQNNQFNTGQGNAYNFNAASLGQQNNQFNAGLAQTQNQINNNMVNQLLGHQDLATQLQMQGQMGQAGMLNQDQQNALQRQMQLQIAQLQQPQLWERGLAAGGGLLQAAMPYILGNRQGGAAGGDSGGGLFNGLGGIAGALGGTAIGGPLGGMLGGALGQMGGGVLSDIGDWMNGMF